MVSANTWLSIYDDDDDCNDDDDGGSGGGVDCKYGILTKLWWKYDSGHDAIDDIEENGPGSV